MGTWVAAYISYSMCRDTSVTVPVVVVPPVPVPPPPVAPSGDFAPPPQATMPDTTQRASKDLNVETNRLAGRFNKAALLNIYFKKMF